MSKLTILLSVMALCLFRSTVSDTNKLRSSSVLVEDDGDVTKHANSQVYTKEALEDQVTDLPDLLFQPPFKHFSGYISVSPTRQIHYWYIESTNDPSTDPLVFWTNGGPGCSGLLGLGTEMGPFIFEKDGLEYNPHTWNQRANILYVEQPAGVGFSFGDKDAGDYDVGDERASIDNYQLIVNFLNRFPNLKENEFYIASESYGGHYIPHLAKQILSQNNDEINFRGFLLGNPYVDPFSNDITMIQTYYMHGLIAKPLYMEWEKQCTHRDSVDEEKCWNLVDVMMSKAGAGINPYALDFPTCLEADSDDNPSIERDHFIASRFDESTSRRKMVASTQGKHLFPSNIKGMVPPPFLPTQDKYHPCAEAHLLKYLNRQDVKEALHVNITKDWSTCSDDINYSVVDSNTPQMDLYESLINIGKRKDSNLKMMIFSGDDDSVCSTASTQYWIYNVGAVPKPDRFWKPWTFNGQTAGFFTEFDLGVTNSSFTFVTVHGAGHEVPAYRPAEAFAMFESFFSGIWQLK